MSTLREKDSLSEETMSATTLFLFLRGSFAIIVYSEHFETKEITMTLLKII